MAELRALAELQPREQGGTRLTYTVWIKPASLLGAIIIPLQLKFVSSRAFAKAFRKYDELASANATVLIAETNVDLPSRAVNRLDNIRDRLTADGGDSSVVDRLIELVQSGDDVRLSRLRPYELADEWRVPRRLVLETCLRATRAGLLDLQWELLCPLCRGVQEAGSSLRDVSSKVHCETCRIDFTANFDRFVEVTFRPNASIRPLEVKDYCMGSPERTPHIVVQQLLAPKSDRTLNLPLEPGRYRVRSLELPGEQDVEVAENGSPTARITLSETGYAAEGLTLAPRSTLQFINATDAEQLLICERTAWGDQATTAAEVTALQIFRDLFSTEALRPGEQISVGTLTVLFTDLKNSTRLYREIGDATAFGRVMSHFDVLRKAIADEEGALVKTIGDAVMAVFRNPASAVRAMLEAQQILAAPPDGSMPLVLKAGIHTGPCIAVTLNDRLDYFGSTVNMAARLESLSTGDDVIISRAVFEDAEVRELLGASGNLAASPFQVELKGFDQEQFDLWRVKRNSQTTAAKTLESAQTS